MNTITLLEVHYLQTSDLINIDPFDNYDVSEIFGDNMAVLRYIVDTVNSCVCAA